MFAIVWIGAFLGIIYQMVFHEKYKILEIVFYLIIGVCPSIVVIDMVIYFIK
jgi:monocyte to macrophage differentiation protein